MGWKVRSGDGAEYTTELLAPEPQLGSGELFKGDKVRGYLAFSVPQDSKGYTLHYKPIVSFRDPLRFRLD